MILILSSSGDDHTRAVMGALSRLGAPSTLVDPADFPRSMGLSLSYVPDAEDFRLQLKSCEIPLSECGAVWWRRPGSIEPHPEVRRETHRRFVFSECDEALSGLWAALDATWMNDPAREQVAARKVWQLKAARMAGLRTPRTLVTTNPAHAHEFLESVGPERVVFKAFSATLQEWRETRLVGEREREHLDSVRYAPVIFQEYVEAECDVRVTVAGDAVHAAAIRAGETAYAVDFRMDFNNAPVEPIELPAPLRRRILALVSDLGLVYGAIDLRRGPDGQYTFLEVNPSGQWLFVEARTSQPITDAVAGCLAKMDSARRTRRRRSRRR